LKTDIFIAIFNSDHKHITIFFKPISISKASVGDPFAAVLVNITCYFRPKPFIKFKCSAAVSSNPMSVKLLLWCCWYS